MPVRTENFDTGGDRNPIGGNWTASFNGSCGVTSQKAGPAPDNTQLYADWWNADSFGDDQYAQVNIVGSGMPFGSTGGPIVRASGTNASNSNGYYMYYGVTVTQLTKVLNGSESLVTSVVEQAANNALDYLEMRGTTLKMFRDGVQKGSDQTDSSIASGAPGVMVQTTSGQADNWEGGDFGVTRRWLLKRTA